MSEIDASLSPSLEPVPSTPKMGRLNRWDTPWLNWKFLSGMSIIGLIVLIGIFGRLFWNMDLVYVASSPLNLPPVGFENRRGQQGTWEHPLGTENRGCDMLALMVIGGPNSLYVGVVAASLGISVGVILGFLAGFIGNWVDDLIRLISDTTLTIPSLLVLIIIQALIPQVSLTLMAFLLALFAWPAPTRLIRAQVLSMRESGYVQMARLSGASAFRLMFGEIMPNLLPYLAASFIGSAAGAILAAVGLEGLGLGPQRVPTLGRTIYLALESSALLRNMWWWWGLPTLVLAIIFIGLLLINLGLDEIANPRLRRASG